MSAGHPSDIVENWTLPDGSAVTLRPIRASDYDAERAFIRNLSPESKFNRFMGELKEVSPALLLYFTRPDPSRDAVYVAVRSTPAGEEQIGVARYASDADGASSEFAVAVADEWQGKGVARRLMDALIRDARARGLRTLEGLVLTSNERMLAFVRRLGFRMEVSRADPTLRRVWLDLA